MPLTGGFGEKIGEWTVERLAKYIKQRVEQDPPAPPPSLVLDKTVVKGKLTVTGELELSPLAVDQLKTQLGL